MANSRKKRLIGAVAIVGVLVAAVPSIGIARETVDWGALVARSSSTLAEQCFDESLAEEDAIYGAAQLFGVSDVDAGTEAIPPEFKQECLSLAGCQGVLSAEEGSLVGFVVDDEPVEAFDDVERELCERGWGLVESGSDTQATFLKDGGCYRWLYVSCIVAGGKTSVVIQCAEGGQR